MSYFMDLVQKARLAPNGKRIVVLNNSVNPLHLNIVITYLYNGNLSLPEDDHSLVQFLKFAQKLQIVDLFRHIGLLLAERVTIQNFKKFWTYGEDYFIVELKIAVGNFVAENMEKLILHQFFRFISPSLMKAACFSPHIQGNRELIYNALLTWANCITSTKDKKFGMRHQYFAFPKATEEVLKEVCQTYHLDFIALQSEFKRNLLKETAGYPKSTVVDINRVHKNNYLVSKAVRSPGSSILRTSPESHSIRTSEHSTSSAIATSRNVKMLSSTSLPTPVCDNFKSSGSSISTFTSSNRVHRIPGSRIPLSIPVKNHTGRKSLSRISSPTSENHVIPTHKSKSVKRLEESPNSARLIKPNILFSPKSKRNANSDEEYFDASADLDEFIHKVLAKQAHRQLK